MKKFLFIFIVIISSCASSPKVSYYFSTDEYLRREILKEKIEIKGPSFDSSKYMELTKNE